MTESAEHPQVGRRFLALGAGEALARVVAFGGGVYLARTLGPDLYGAVVLATAVVLYGARISDCGVDLFGVTDVARDRANLDWLLVDRLGARLFVAMALAVGLTCVGLWFMPQPDGVILALYGLTLLPVALRSTWAHLGLERSDVVATARVATEAVAVLLIVVLVRSGGDVSRAPIAQLVGEAAGAYLMMRYLASPRLRLRTVFSLGPVLELYRRAWPLVLHALLGLMIFNIDFFFLRAIYDAATVGYYAAAYALVSFVLNVGNTYSFSLLPTLASASDDAPRQQRLYHDAMAQVFAGALPFAVGGAVVAQGLVAVIFGARYMPAVLPLQILCFTIPGSMFRGVAQSVLVARGRQDQLLRTTAWSFVANLVLNVVLIPRWGMTGAAVATLGSALLRVILMVSLIRKGGLALPTMRRFWRSLVAAVAMAVAVVGVTVSGVWVSIALGGVTYLTALFALGGIRLQANALPELRV